MCIDHIFGYGKVNDDDEFWEDDDRKVCVLGCDDKFCGDENKGLGKSKGVNHAGLHDEYRIWVCDDEDIVKKYVDNDDMKEYGDDDVGVYNDHLSISDDDLEDVKVIWNVYNADVDEIVDVVGVCMNDEIRVDVKYDDAHVYV